MKVLFKISVSLRGERCIGVRRSDGNVIAEDGIPFVVVGDGDLECHYGAKYVGKKTRDDEQVN